MGDQAFCEIFPVNRNTGKCKQTMKAFGEKNVSLTLFDVTSKVTRRSHLHNSPQNFYRDIIINDFTFVVNHI